MRTSVAPGPRLLETDEGAKGKRGSRAASRELSAYQAVLNARTTEMQLSLLHLLAVVSGVVVLAAGCGGSEADDTEPAPSAAAASCVEKYSPAALADRAFAFDGTVTSVELREDPWGPQQGGQASMVPWVTFSVNRWYAGGSADEVGVWIDFLNATTSAGTVEGEPGTRILVAGEPAFGGEPLDDPIAWPCGFTQPYTEEAAANWERALSPQS